MFMKQNLEITRCSKAKCCCPFTCKYLNTARKKGREGGKEGGRDIRREGGRKVEGMNRKGK